MSAAGHIVCESAGGGLETAGGRNFVIHSQKAESAGALSKVPARRDKQYKQLNTRNTNSACIICIICFLCLFHLHCLLPMFVLSALFAFYGYIVCISYYLWLYYFPDDSKLFVLFVGFRLVGPLGPCRPLHSGGMSSGVQMV